MKKKTTTNATKDMGFETLCNRFSIECGTWLSSGKKSDTTELESYLNTLGNIIAYSVLNKLIDPQKKGIQKIIKNDGKENYVSNTGYSETIVKLKNELTLSNIELDTLKRVSYKPHETIIDKDGNEKQVIVDRDSYNKLIELSRQTIGNGIDFKQEAIATLLELSEKMYNEIGYIDVMKHFTTYVPNKKTWYKDIFKEIQLKKVETCIIQETFKAVRRLVENASSVKAVINGYGYLECNILMDNGKEEKIYKRLKHYHDNGSCDNVNNMYSTDFYSDFDTMAEKLELTARQTTVLNYRLQGVGVKAIAGKLGISTQAVRCILECIGKKAIVKMNISEELAKQLTRKDNIETSTKKRTKLNDVQREEIKKLVHDGYTYAYIAGLYNVSKMTISNVVNKNK